MSMDPSEGENEAGMEVNGINLIHASKDSFDDDTARRKSTQRGGSPTAQIHDNIVIIQP